MRSKVLVSMLALFIVMPMAMGAVGDTNFTNGQTDVSSCTIDVLGVDENTAVAEPRWQANTYACNAGTYLPDGDNWVGLDDGCQACPTGSYCTGSGVTPFTYSEDADQGITSCPSGFPSSDANSDAETDCYRTCSAGDVANLKSGGTVSGRYYSGNTNMCEPSNASQCAAGFHYVAGSPNLSSIIGDTSGTASAATDSQGGTADGNPSNYSISGALAFAVDYGSSKGVIRGHGRCSTESGTTTTTLTDATGTGTYCWCKMDSYTPNAGSAQAVSASWVYYNSMSDATTCADECAASCADQMSNSSAFRTTAFGTVQSSLAACVANEITLNWKDADGNVHYSNTCTYGGTLSTPTTAPTKRGHTFTGWRFVAQ